MKLGDRDVEDQVERGIVRGVDRHRREELRGGRFDDREGFAHGDRLSVAGADLGLVVMAGGLGGLVVVVRIAVVVAGGVPVDVPVAVMDGVREVGVFKRGRGPQQGDGRDYYPCAMHLCYNHTTETAPLGRS